MLASALVLTACSSDAATAPAEAAGSVAGDAGSTAGQTAFHGSVADTSVAGAPADAAAAGMPAAAAGAREARGKRAATERVNGRVRSPPTAAGRKPAASTRGMDKVMV